MRVSRFNGDTVADPVCGLTTPEDSVTVMRLTTVFCGPRCVPPAVRRRFLWGLVGLQAMYAAFAGVLSAAPEPLPGPTPAVVAEAVAATTRLAFHPSTEPGPPMGSAFCIDPSGYFLASIPPTRGLGR